MNGAWTKRITSRVVFFGDSICFGQGVSPHRGWVTRLAEESEIEFASQRATVTIHNASVNGNTTRQALERIAFDVQSHGLDAMVLQFGLNDANYWASDMGLPRVSEKSFCANLEEIIQRAMHFGARRIQLHTNHLVTKQFGTKSNFPIAYEESVQRYNELIRMVAASAPREIVLVDIEAQWLQHLESTGMQQGSFLLEDGVHLSEEGHELYFRFTRNPFIQMLMETYAA